MTDTPMPEAPSTEFASTTQHQTAAAAPIVKQEQQHPGPEQAPPTTDMPLASTFPREHPPREPTSRQPTPRLYDNIPPDRKPLHLSSYPTAPNSVPQTPHPVMSAPSALRPRTGTLATDRVPRLSGYPTAPGSASQTPQPGHSQMPQQGMSAAGWLVPPAANSASKITFEGMPQAFLFPYPSILSFPSSFPSFSPSFPSSSSSSETEKKR